MKRTTLKDIKASGWYDFVEWATRKGYGPYNITQDLVFDWNVHRAFLSVSRELERDLYEVPKIKKIKKIKYAMAGLSEQVTEQKCSKRPKTQKSKK